MAKIDEIMKPARDALARAKAASAEAEKSMRENELAVAIYKNSPAVFFGNAKIIALSVLTDIATDLKNLVYVGSRDQVSRPGTTGSFESLASIIFSLRRAGL